MTFVAACSKFLRLESESLGDFARQLKALDEKDRSELTAAFEAAGIEIDS